jgi:hypothetical protein
MGTRYDLRTLLSIACSSEWRNRQTRQLEGLVPARAWGFKSPLRHDQNPTPSAGLLVEEVQRGQTRPHVGFHRKWEPRPVRTAAARECGSSTDCRARNCVHPPSVARWPSADASSPTTARTFNAMPAGTNGVQGPPPAHTAESRQTEDRHRVGRQGRRASQGRPSSATGCKTITGIRRFPARCA